jgi:catechol 2,3-dioxygenase-like lactoylglutathione lyase family enzyme
VKTHLNFAATDLAKSAEFYSALLDAKPTKMLPDYVLFITEQPGLELALDLATSVPPTRDVHYGILVESVAEVEHAIKRLDRIGAVSSIERDETCCYANQSKVWSADPDGRRWEVYAVHEDTGQRDGLDAKCCLTDGETPSCCVTQAAGL